MSTTIKRDIPMLIITVLGVLMIVDFFLPIEAGHAAAGAAQKWAAIIYGFAMIYGGLSLLLYNFKWLIERVPGRWIYALATIVAFAVTTISGFIPPWTQHWVFKWMYDYTYLPPAGTIYGMLAFYILSAAYRAVKIRNIESAVFAVCAWFMIMRNAPLIHSVTTVFFNFGDWISKVPSNAGWRAFYIGAAIGTVALAMRTFVWRERGAIGGE
jgi:hypothetical protein